MSVAQDPENLIFCYFAAKKEILLNLVWFTLIQSFDNYKAIAMYIGCNSTHDGVPSYVIHKMIGIDETNDTIASHE